MILKRLLNLLFPEGYSCICCGDEIFDKENQICDKCLKNLPYLLGRLCLHCGDPLISDGNYCKRCKGRKFYFDKAISPFIFDGEIKFLIHNLKYNNNRFLAKPLAGFMVDRFISEKIYVDIIVPVPLCKKRLKERGYNQSLLLANEISSILNLPVYENLIRIKDTPSQTNLDFMERQKNLKDAFKVLYKKDLKDKSVLLIDDVFTTGATTKECARLLKNAGAKSVYVLTFAHTIKQDMNKKEEK